MTNTEKAINWINSAQKPITIVSRTYGIDKILCAYTLNDSKNEYFYTGMCELDFFNTDKIE